MKTVVFTHNDLDGVSCGIIAKLFFKSAIVYYCDYNEINDKMISILPTLQEKTRIVISDISYKRENSRITDLLLYHDVYIADHHATSAWMKGIFENENLENDGDKCASVLLYELLKKAFAYRLSKYNIERIEAFLHDVNDWDIWKWVEKANYDNLYDNDSLWLNNAMYVIGSDLFVKKMLSYFNGAEYPFNDEDGVKIEDYNRNQYTEISNAVTFRRYGHYNSELYGDLKFMYIELTNKFQSLASLLANNVRDDSVDFILLVNGENGSLRCPREGLDLSKLAYELGGGGHKTASGFKYNDHVPKFILDD